MPAGTDQKVFDEHAREFEAGFLDDMNALGVRPADVLTRITEYVPQVITMDQGGDLHGLGCVGRMLAETQP